ncbi:SWIM zinc finger family protein [Mycolicibacterium aichiense]|uniref:SWIM zinc finger family protein n=1 Tax=Mycolicibacterium aichiense TaxID=1799 RepID=UPI003D67896B
MPAGSCTCPHNAEGNFCKHLVATGLAAIDTGRIPANDTASRTVESAVEAMDVVELRLMKALDAKRL